MRSRQNPQKEAVKDVSFTVHSGEIVCIAGIDGNGQSELVYAITGLEPIEKGTIVLNGEDITKKNIRHRNTHGMSHIPEDRHKHGLVLDYSLEQNMVLQRYFEPQFQKGGFIKFDEVRKYAEGLIDKFDVRSGQGPITKARSMSGGNQQKQSLQENSTDRTICSLRCNLQEVWTLAQSNISMLKS